MAKRKKSKPKSDQVAEATAPDSNESAAPTRAEVEHALSEKTPAPASGEGFPWQTDADKAEPAGEPAASEALSAAPIANDLGSTSAESPAVDGTSAPVEVAAEEVADEPPSETTEMATATSEAEASEMTPPSPDDGAASLEGSRLESIIESLLFASDKPLGLAEFKRLLGERDGKKVTAAIEALALRRKGMGVEVVALSSGWHLRTNPENADWVAKLLVGRPVRLSRAMLETLAIVAYRQPVTRPEIDDIRGVDCGPVLKTLLDRGLVRIIGKKEEVGRPLLYGTTPEFLRVFNLRDLSELPTLREFYDLSAEDQSRVQAEHGAEAQPQTTSATTPKPDVAISSVTRGALAPEPEEADPLLDELDEASQLAKQALSVLEPEATEEAVLDEAGAEAEAKAAEEPPASARTSDE